MAAPQALLNVPGVDENLPASHRSSQKRATSKPQDVELIKARDSIALPTEADSDVAAAIPIDGSKDLSESLKFLGRLPRVPLPKESSWRTSCPYYRFSVLLVLGCQALGRNIGRRPIKYLLCGLLAQAIAIGGLVFLDGDAEILFPFVKLTTNMDQDFIVTNSSYHSNLETANESFPIARTSRLIFTSTSGRVMSYQFLHQSLLIRRKLELLSAEHDGNTYRFSDLCLRKYAGGDCAFTSFLDIVAPTSVDISPLENYTDADLTDSLLANVTSAQRAHLQWLSDDSSNFPANVENDAAMASWLLKVTSFRVSFDLQAGRPSRELERTLSEFLMQNNDLAGLGRVSGWTSETSAEEVKEVAEQILFWTLIANAVAAVLVAALLGLQARNPIQTQVAAMFVAALDLPALSLLSALGVMGYWNLEVPALGVVALPLVSVLILYGMHLLVSALREVGAYDAPLQESLAWALASVGPSMIIAGLGSLVFIGGVAWGCEIGAMHGGVHLCLFLALAVLFARLNTILVFPAFVVMNEVCTELSRDPVLGPQPSPFKRFDFTHHIRKVVEVRLPALFGATKILPGIGVVIFLTFVILGPIMVTSWEVKQAKAGYWFGEDSTVETYELDRASYFSSKELTEFDIFFSKPILISPDYRTGIATLMTDLRALEGVESLTCVLETLAASVASYQTAEIAVNTFFTSSESLEYQRDTRFLKAGTLSAARCRLLVQTALDWSGLEEQGETLRKVVEGANLDAILYHDVLATKLGWQESFGESFHMSYILAAVAVVVLVMLVLPLGIAYFAVLCTGCVSCGILVITRSMDCTMEPSTIPFFTVALCLGLEPVMHALVASAQAGLRDSSWLFPSRRVMEVVGFDLLSSGLVGAIGSIILCIAAKSEGLNEWAGVYIFTQLFGVLVALWIFPSVGFLLEPIERMVLLSEELWIGEYFVDNRKLHSPLSGLPQRRTRNIMDVDPKLPVLHWNEPVRGKALDNRWFQVENGGLIPIFLNEIRIVRPMEGLEKRYLVDNRSLRATSQGLRHRKAKDYTALHPSFASPWFDYLEGIDLRDGWLRTTAGSFVPFYLEGQQVLTPAEDAYEEMLLDNRMLSVHCKGLRPRTQRKLRAIDTHADLFRWGSSVRGIDLLNGWVRLESASEHYLPTHIKGCLVLAPKSELTESELIEIIEDSTTLAHSLGQGAVEDLPSFDMEEADPTNLPRNWEHAFDLQQRRPYFYNIETGDRSWTSPLLTAKASDLPPGWIESVDEATGMIYYIDTLNETSTWVHPNADNHSEASAEWEEITDPSTGMPYYFNRTTGITTWDRPEGMASALVCDSRVGSRAGGPSLGSTGSMLGTGVILEEMDEESSLLPPGWRMRVDPAGNTYYENREMGVVQWDSPADQALQDLELALAIGSGSPGAVHYLRRSTYSESNKSVLPPPSVDESLPPGWERVEDGEAGTYYQNMTEGLTQWEKPGKVNLPNGWQQFMDWESGTLYYANAAKNVSQWSTPRGSQAPDEMVLPLGWDSSFDPTSGMVYFYNEKLGISQWEPPLFEEEASNSGPTSAEMRKFRSSPSVGTWYMPRRVLPTAARRQQVPNAGGDEASTICATYQGNGNAGGGMMSSEEVVWGSTMMLSQGPEARTFVVVNDVLKSVAPGLRHRVTKNMLDFHPTIATAWGLTVEGRWVGEGWVETVVGHYLPTHIDGCCVLFLPEEAEEWMLDVRTFSSSHSNLTFRRSKDLLDVADFALNPRVVVRGQDLGDGWVRTVDGFYLPITMGKKQMLVKTEVLRQQPPPRPFKARLLARRDGTSGDASPPPPPSFGWTGHPGASKDHASSLPAGKGTVAHSAAAAGRALSLDPGASIAGLLAIYLLLSLGMVLLEGDAWMGFLRVKVDTFEEISISGARFRSDYDRAMEYFGDTWQGRLIYYPRDDSTSLFNVDFLKKGRALETELLYSQKTAAGNTYNNLCERQSGETGLCEHVSFFDILVPIGTDVEAMAEEAGGDDAKSKATNLALKLLRASTASQRSLLPIVVGEPTLPWPGDSATLAVQAAWLAEARAVQVVYSLRTGAESMAWQKVIEAHLDKVRDDESSPVLLSGEFEHSTLSSLSYFMAIVMPWSIPLAWLLTSLFIAIILSGTTRMPCHRSLHILAIMTATLAPALSSCAIWGLVGFCGGNLTVLSLCSALPAMLVSIPSIFVMVNSWKTVPWTHESQPQFTIAAAWASAAPPIMAGGLTAIAVLGAVAFTLGNIPALGMALLLAALILLLTLAAIVIVLPGLLSLVERLPGSSHDAIGAELDDGLGKRTCKTRVDGFLRFIFGLEASGRKHVKKELAVLPQRSLTFRLFGAGLGIAILVAGAVYTGRLSGGLNGRFSYRDDSNLDLYYSSLKSGFGGSRTREVSLVLPSPLLSDSSYFGNLTELLTTLTARSDVRGQDCWVQILGTALDGTSATEEEASVALFTYLSSSAGEVYIKDASFQDGILNAARCRLWLTQPLDLDAEVQQVEALNTIVAGYSVNGQLVHRSWATDLDYVEEGRGLMFRGLFWSVLATLAILLMAVEVPLAAAATLACCSAGLASAGIVRGLNYGSNILTMASVFVSFALAADIACLFAWAVPEVPDRPNRQSRRRSRRRSSSKSSNNSKEEGGGAGAAEQEGEEEKQQSKERCSSKEEQQSIEEQSKSGLSWSVRTSQAWSAVGFEILYGYFAIALLTIFSCMIVGFPAGHLVTGLVFVFCSLATFSVLVFLPAITALVGDVLLLPTEMRSRRESMKALLKWIEQEEDAEELVRAGRAEEEALHALEDVGEPRLSRCSAAVQRKLSRTLRIWGLALAQKPLGTVFCGLAAGLLLAAGLCLVEGDMWLAFSRVSSDFLEDFSDHESMFYKDLMAKRDQFNSRSLNVLMAYPRSASKGVLSMDFLAAGLALETELQSLKVEHEGRRYLYRDLCYRANRASDCEMRSPFSLLLSSDQAIATGWTLNESAIDLGEELVGSMANDEERLYLASTIAGGGRETWEGFPDSSNSTKITAWLMDQSVAFVWFSIIPSAAGKAMERRIATWLEERSGSSALRLRGKLGISLGDESAHLITSAKWFAVITGIVMTLYTLLFLGKQTRSENESQYLLIICALLMHCLSVAAAVGSIGYLGLRINFLASIAPFVGLSVGLSGLFMLVGALKQSPTPEAATGGDTDAGRLVSSALADAGPSLVLSWLTSIVAFVAAMVCAWHFPALLTFNLIMLLTTTYSQLCNLIVFPAMLILNEKRILEGRRDIFFWRYKPDPSNPQYSSAGSDGMRAAGSYDSQGSIRSRRKNTALFERTMSAVMTLEGIESKVRDNFLSVVAPLAEESRMFRIMGSMLYVALVVFGLVVLRELDRGMPDVEFTRDSSYLRDFLEDEEAVFNKYSLEPLNLVIWHPNATNDTYRETLATTLETFQNHSDVVLPDCWVNAFGNRYRRVSRTDSCSFAQTWLSTNNAANAYQVGSAASTVTPSDVTCNEDGSIKAARCTLWFWQSEEAEKRAEQAEALHYLASTVGASVSISHEVWAEHVSRHLSISRITVISLVLAAALCVTTAAIFLPLHFAIVGGLNVSFVVFVAFGLLSLGGFTCNVVTYSAMMAGLGFAIDLTAHLCYCTRYRVPKGMKWRERASQAMRICGIEMLHTCLASFVGVLFLLPSGSTAIRSFVAVVVLCLFFAGFFALVGLPALVAFVEEEAIVWDGDGKEKEHNVATLADHPKEITNNGKTKTNELCVETLGNKVLYKGVKVLLKEEAAAKVEIDKSGFSWDAHRPHFTGKICTVSDVACYGGKGFKVGGCPFGWPLSAIEQIFENEVSAELIVTIVEARGLQATKLFKSKKSDPYCTCQLVGKEDSLFKTPVQMCTLEPKWNHEAFIGNFVNGDTLVFEVWDNGINGKHKHFLGRALLKSKHFYPKGFTGDNTWLRLEGTGKQHHSSLRVNVVVASKEKWAVPANLVTTLGVAKAEVTPRLKAITEVEEHHKQEVSLMQTLAAQEPNRYALPGQIWEPPETHMEQETTMTPEDVVQATASSAVQHRSYVLDNCELKSTAKFMRKRKSKDEFDFHPSAMVMWGETVLAQEVGDGWVQIQRDGLYLPIFIDDKRVLFPKDQPALPSNTAGSPKGVKVPEDQLALPSPERTLQEAKPTLPTDSASEPPAIRSPNEVRQTDDTVLEVRPEGDA